MHPALLQNVLSKMPKMNPLLAKGIARSQMCESEVLEQISRNIRSAFKSLPDEIEFVSLTQVMPTESYDFMTKQRYSRHVFETARSDVYVVKAIFKVDGVEMGPAYFYMLFCGQAGEVFLRNSRFNLIPVLADGTFSVADASIFLNISKDSIIWSSTQHHFMVNDERTSNNVVYAQIYRPKTSQLGVGGTKLGINCKPAIIVNLFAKYGPVEAFLKYCGAGIVIGDSHSINTQMYDPENWTIFRSYGFTPRTWKAGTVYIPSDIRVAVPREEASEEVMIFMSSLFYVVDHYPHLLHTNVIGYKEQWQLVLGLIYLNNKTTSHGQIQCSMEGHLGTLDNYLDSTSQARLQISHVNCKDFYDLLYYVATNYSMLVINSDPTSLYDKEFMVRRYVLKDIEAGINSLTYDLLRIIKSRGRLPTPLEFNKSVESHIKPEIIFELSKSSHKECESIAYSGDCMALRITNKMVCQSSAQRKGGKRQDPITDPSKTLHESIAEVASMLGKNKSEGTGREAMNHFCTTTTSGVVVRNERCRALLDNVHAQIVSEE